MPELPEVETVARGLRQRALGRRICQVEVRHPGIIKGSPEEFVRQTSGRTIVAVRRKGKVLVLELDGCGGEPKFLMVRLGMTGQVTLEPREAPMEPHTHVRMPLDDGREELRFRDPRRFGNLRVLERGGIEGILGTLGPDAQAISEEDFLRSMHGRRGALKSWLMNQQMLAGLGNIYADEALFVARLHPLAQPGHISCEAARRLYRAVRRVLDRAVNLQGTSFRDYIDLEGRPGNFAMRLKVYQRDGKLCARCRTPIRRIVVGGRSSHFCPRCQPRPRRAAGHKTSRKGTGREKRHGLADGRRKQG
jgi:formamidopyrimidine-DNA glycosylase